MINFEDFAKLEMRVGTVLKAEEIEGSEKLLKLTIDLGEDSPRQVISGIKAWYSPEDLVSNQYIFVANLEPKQIMGLDSQAMIMATGEDNPTLLIPQQKVANGSKVR